MPTPRLWTYQNELPGRTVLHLTLGIAVGALLIIKISIVRFFKHMESTLAPFLGTALLICTLLLTGMALPCNAREAYLRATAQDGENFSQERTDRVAKFLPLIGFADEAGLLYLASSAGLAKGRDVLTRKCTQCHDLRTILVKPRTPEAWHRTVTRMATRSSTLMPISESEMERHSLSHCHSSRLVEETNLSTRQDAVVLMTRMVANGLTAEDAELSQIATYISNRIANEQSP